MVGIEDGTDVKANVSDLAPDEKRFAELAPTIANMWNGLTKEALGRGDNPHFRNAPEDVVLSNYCSPSRERPICYAVGENGQYKRFLTEADLQEAREKQPKSDVPAEQLARDMFSLMVGGRKPTIRQLGLDSLTDLIPEPGNTHTWGEKARRVLAFVTENPNTHLTHWINGQLGLSFGTAKALETTIDERSANVLVTGTACGVRRNVFYVWHDMRNMMHTDMRSPMKTDGDISFKKPHDIFLVFRKDGKQVVRRMNAIVLFLARHGISEGMTEATDPDQAYITLDEYRKYIYPSDVAEQARNLAEEEENYRIVHQPKSSQEVIQERIAKIQERLAQMETEGLFDTTISSIEEYEAENT